MRKLGCLLLSIVMTACTSSPLARQPSSTSPTAGEWNLMLVSTQRQQAFAQITDGVNFTFAHCFVQGDFARLNVVDAIAYLKDRARAECTYTQTIQIPDDVAAAAFNSNVQAEWTRQYRAEADFVGRDLDGFLSIAAMTGASTATLYAFAGIKEYFRPGSTKVGPSLPWIVGVGTVVAVTAGAYKYNESLKKTMDETTIERIWPAALKSNLESRGLDQKKYEAPKFNLNVDRALDIYWRMFQTVAASSNFT